MTLREVRRYSADPIRERYRANAQIVRKFFATLAAMESKKGSRADIRLRADRANDSPIILDTRPSRPK